MSIQLAFDGGGSTSRDNTAGRFAEVIGAAGYVTLVPPSSSPANAMLSFEQKLQA